MPKGIQKTALGASGVAQGQAGSAYGTISPIYAQMAQNPQGYTPQQKSNMLTASAQSLGGVNAGVVGQGALAAQRTNNAGGYMAALDDAARVTGEQQSENALGIQNKSAMLAREQQGQGLAGLSSIYADANSTGQGYLHTANEAAANNPWMKLLMQSMQSAGTAATGNLGG